MNEMGDALRTTLESGRSSQTLEKRVGNSKETEKEERKKIKTGVTNEETNLAADDEAAPTVTRKRGRPLGSVSATSVKSQKLAAQAAAQDQLITSDLCWSGWWRAGGWGW